MLNFDNDDLDLENINPNLNPQPKITKTKKDGELKNFCISPMISNLTNSVNSIQILRYTFFFFSIPLFFFPFLFFFSSKIRLTIFFFLFFLFFLFLLSLFITQFIFSPAQSPNRKSQPKLFDASLSPLTPKNARLYFFSLK